MPLLVAHCPSGIFPAWHDCQIALPNTPRIVIATDNDGTYMAVYEADPHLPANTWNCAATGDEFDSIITHWMECPDPPEN